MIQIFKRKVLVEYDTYEDTSVVYCHSVEDVNAIVKALMQQYLLLYPDKEKKDILISINYVTLPDAAVDTLFLPEPVTSHRSNLPIYVPASS